MTDHKFTGEEVMQALDICRSVDTPKDCDGCPYERYRDTCVNELSEAAADLIKRQRAEIERLQKLLDDKCDRCIEREHAKAAREIFAEIYKTMNSLYSKVQHSLVGSHGDLPETMRLFGNLEGIKYLGDEIAELKKKFPEVKP